MLLMCFVPLNYGCKSAKQALKPIAGALHQPFTKVKNYSGKCGKYVWGFVKKRYTDPNDAVGDINTASNMIGKKYLEVTRKNAKKFKGQYAYNH